MTEMPSNVKSEDRGNTSPSPPSSSPRKNDVPSSILNPDCAGSSASSSSNSGDSEENSKPDNSSDHGAAAEGTSTKEEPIDSESVKGIFGWETLDSTSIPYLLRRKRKYVSIRIVERKLLSKYPNASPDELGKKDPLISHFITEAEANLLNEINISHCDYEYGETPFTEKDLVVDLEEFQEFFSVVKKTFPEEILASMKGEVTTSPQPAETPPSSDLSQCCGWIQINNTVSPYIIRGAGKDQVKLVPLSVIVYAAGLLANTNIKGLNPTAVECKMLNAACKAAGFDFTFGRNTRLIAISEVVQRCQVQIFELPFSNPLQHAHYLDQRMVSPMTSAAAVTPPLRQLLPPPYSSRGVHGNPPPMQVDSAGGRPPLFVNPFHPRIPGPDLRPGGMMPPGLNFDPRQMVHDKNNKLSNLDPSQFPVSIQQALLDKCQRMESTAPMNTFNKLPPNVRPPYWPLLHGQPPPAHSGKMGMGMVSKTPPSPFNGPSPSLPSSSSSTYHPHSLPPNPLLHPNPLDINQSMYRMPQLPSPSSKDSSKHNSSTIPKQGPQGPMPLPQHHQGSFHSPHGNNHFNSSLFTRTESSESKLNQLPSSVISSMHCRSTSPATAKPSGSNQPLRRASNTSNTNEPPKDLVKCISACLVNGKSISCLDANHSERKGKYCLVEAVSKLYFPAVPIAEFLKVLQVVLKANLYPCTPEEESAFVKYYNLPAPRLKCNQMILVEDLQRYFPQLTYVFSRRSANHASPEEINGNRGQKRTIETAPPGPHMKQAVLQNMMGKVCDDPNSLQGSEGTSNGGNKSSVIVIDD